MHSVQVSENRMKKTTRVEQSFLTASGGVSSFTNLTSQPTRRWHKPGMSSSESDSLHGRSSVSASPSSERSNIQTDLPVRVQLDREGKGTKEANKRFTSLKQRVRQLPSSDGSLCFL
jgi:hypothetical protein